MRRILIILAMLAALIVPAAFSISASAQDPNVPLDPVCTGAAASSPVCASKDQSENPLTGPDGIITNTVRIISFMVGVAAVFMVILGGLKYVTSNGDSNSTASAKNTILYAVIGIIVFLLSQAIVIFVISKI